MILGLSEQDWGIRVAIYQHFIKNGKAPSIADLGSATGYKEAEIETSLLRLADNHHVVLAPATNNIWMANPFSATPTAFRVEASGIVYWANCAWDSLGIPVILKKDAYVRARCAESGELMEYSVKDGEVKGGDGVIHFLVPPRSFYENIGFT